MEADAGAAERRGSCSLKGLCAHRSLLGMHFLAHNTFKDVQKWPFVPSPSPTLPE